MAHALFIDGNSIGYANQYATKLTAGSLQIQAVFGFIKTLRKLLGDVYPSATPLVLWDGRAQWRFELYGAYKSNRGDDPKRLEVKCAYEAQKPILHKMLQLLGVRQLTCMIAEADDMAGLMSRQLSGRGQFVTLVSGDQDWLQLVNDYVDWFDPIRDNRVNLGNFFKFTGYRTPAQFLQGKCLVGDASDMISGVGGIGKEGAPLFLAQFGTVEEFWRRCDAGEFEPAKKAHLALWKGSGRENYARNMKLMNLLDVPKPDPATVKIDPGNYNEAGFRVLCERLAFASILREFEGFVAPFRARQLKAAA